MIEGVSGEFTNPRNDFNQSVKFVKEGLRYAMFWEQTGYWFVQNA